MPPRRWHGACIPSGMENLDPDLLRALIAIEHALSLGDAAVALATVRLALDLALLESGANISLRAPQSMGQ